MLPVINQRIPPILSNVKLLGPVFFFFLSALVLKQVAAALALPWLFMAGSSHYSLLYVKDRVYYTMYKSLGAAACKKKKRGGKKEGWCIVRMDLYNCCTLICFHK